MVGILNDIKDNCTMPFKDKGNLVFLLGSALSQSPEPFASCHSERSEEPRLAQGKLREGASEGSLGGSEYLELVHGLVKGKPVIDLDLEKKVQGCCLEAIRRGLIKSAHDCSEGGLAVAIAESCLAGNIGFRSEGWRITGRLDSTLFGEQQPRIVVSISLDSAVELGKTAMMWNVPLTRLGKIGGKRLLVKGYIDLSLAEMGEAWHSLS